MKLTDGDIRNLERTLALVGDYPHNVDMVKWAHSQFDFVAAARMCIPELLAERDAMRAQLAAAKAALDAMEERHKDCVDGESYAAACKELAELRAHVTDYLAKYDAWYAATNDMKGKLSVDIKLEDEAALALEKLRGHSATKEDCPSTDEENAKGSQ